VVVENRDLPFYMNSAQTGLCRMLFAFGYNRPLSLLAGLFEALIGN